MKFSLLLRCRREDLAFFEQRTINALMPRYNISLIVGTMIGVEWSPERRAAHSARLTGRKDTDETRAKKSASGKERHRLRPTTIETRQAIGAKHVGNSHAAGAVRSAETREKMSISQKARLANGVPKNALGHVVSNKTRAGISAKLKGRQRSPESIAKQRATIAARKT